MWTQGKYMYIDLHILILTLHLSSCFRLNGLCVDDTVLLLRI